MSWAGTITNNGRALLARWITGTNLTVTAVKGGTGTTQTPESATALASEKQTMTIMHGRTESEKFLLEVQATSHTQSYTLNQIGIFAKIGSEAAVLIALYQNSDGVNIPSSASSPDFVYGFTAAVAIGSSGTLTVTVDPDAYASKTYVDELGETCEKSENRVTEITPSTASDNTYPTTKAVKDQLDQMQKSSERTDTVNDSAASGSKYPSELAIYRYMKTGQNITTSVSIPSGSAIKSLIVDSCKRYGGLCFMAVRIKVNFPGTAMTYAYATINGVTPLYAAACAASMMRMGPTPIFATFNTDGKLHIYSNSNTTSQNDEYKLSFVFPV